MLLTRRFWSWLLLLGIGTTLLGCAFYFDPFVRNWIVAHPNRGFHEFMGWISRLGDWPTHVVVGLALVAIARWRKSKTWTRIFLSMLIACALAGAAARVIKVATGRARPSVNTEEAWTGPSLSEKFHAFPSGHVAASAAFFGVLFFANKRVGLCCLIIPMVIGVSRMYVAAHYLSDVVCAGVLGVFCAWIIARIMLRGEPIADH